jgi:hypothetical protein
MFYHEKNAGMFLGLVKVLSMVLNLFCGAFGGLPWRGRMLNIDSSAQSI